MIDLLISGGGPAGLFTALHASRAGLEVAVVEPRAAPIDKACGEGLMPGGLRRLQQIGLGPAGHDLRGIRYVRGGRTAEARFRSGLGRGVRRIELHNALSQAAAAAGIRVERGSIHSVSQQSDCIHAGGFQARYLVAADGLHSPLRRSLGLTVPVGRTKRWGIRRHVEITPWSDFVEVHWGDDAEAYLTPVGERLLGIAILSRAQRSFDEHLRAFPELIERLGGAKAAGSDRGAGPLRHQARRQVAGRVLLVGDAAGYIDALTGEGLGLTFATASELVAAVLAGRPDQYQRRWRQLSRRHQLITRSLLASSALGPVRKALVPAARQLPGLFSATVNALAD
jgi:flavin-dependent dehydrogenase